MAETRAAVGGGDLGERPRLLYRLSAVVIWAAVLARLLSRASDPSLRLWYVAGLAAFLVILVIVLWRPTLATWLLNVAFALQSAIVLLLLAQDPEQDFLTGLFMLQCYQAAFVFAARTLIVWVAALVSLIGASLVFEMGPLRGFALALVPMAAGVVLPTFIVIGRELEITRAASQRLVADLQTAQRELTAYAGQVDELAAIEERSRVARELQESVSRTLSDVLTVTRATQALLDEPAVAGPELERLQRLTQQALAQMREIIAELRPVSEETAADR